GVTIFLTTQYLDEADQLADRIAVLDHGQLVAQGTPAELKRLIPGGHVSLRFADAAGLAAAVRLLGDQGEGARDDEALTLRVPSAGSVAELRPLLNRLEAGPAGLAELSVHTPDLDDVFLTLTGQPQLAAEKEILR